MARRKPDLMEEVSSMDADEAMELLEAVERRLFELWREMYSGRHPAPRKKELDQDREF